MSCRRVVLLRFPDAKDAGAIEAVRAVHDGFSAIPGVHCAEAVRPVQVRSGGLPYTHLSLFEFRDEAARETYESHPLHTGARPEVRSRVAAVAVLDLV